MSDDQTEHIQEALQLLRRSEMKLIVKEAIKEWLDEQASHVGRWSIRYVVMIAIAAGAYYILLSQGWTHK